MVNLSWMLQKLFQLHGAVPRLLWPDGRALLPIHMMIEVTYRCNLRCNYCHYLDIIEGKAKPIGASQRDLPLDDILRYVDDLPRGRLISFSGGETLVRKDFPEILRRATRRHRVHIITNGALISERVAQSYIDQGARHAWQNGLVLVEVSLEGGEERHDRITQRAGSWKRTIDGIRHLVRLRKEAGKAFPRLTLKLVVTNETYTSMVDFMHLARELGVDLVNFLAEHDLTGNAEGRLENLQRPQRPPEGVDLAVLRQQLIRCHELEREWGLQIRLTPHVPIDEFVSHFAADRSLDPSEYVCEGLWSRLGIAGDGRYGGMCPYAATGDMRTTSLRELWNSEPLKSFRRETKAARLYPGCHGCCNLTYVGSRRHGLEGLSTPAPPRLDGGAPADPACAAPEQPAVGQPPAVALLPDRPSAPLT